MWYVTGGRPDLGRETAGERNVWIWDIPSVTTLWYGTGSIIEWNRKNELVRASTVDCTLNIWMIEQPSDGAVVRSCGQV